MIDNDIARLCRQNIILNILKMCSSESNPISRKTILDYAHKYYREDIDDYFKGSINPRTVDRFFAFNISTVRNKKGNKWYYDSGKENPYYYFFLNMLDIFSTKVEYDLRREFAMYDVKDTYNNVKINVLDENGLRQRCDIKAIYNIARAISKGENILCDYKGNEILLKPIEILYSGGKFYVRAKNKLSSEFDSYYEISKITNLVVTKKENFDDYQNNKRTILVKFETRDKKILQDIMKFANIESKEDNTYTIECSKEDFLDYAMSKPDKMTIKYPLEIVETLTNYIMGLSKKYSKYNTNIKKTSKESDCILDTDLSNKTDYKEYEENQTIILKNNNIKDVDFLQNFHNLENISVYDNAIKDFNVVSDKCSIKKLDLIRTNISDFSFLKGQQYKSLRYLTLTADEKFDFDNIQNDEIKSISVASDSFDNLQKLDDFKYLTDINLTCLRSDKNQKAMNNIFDSLKKTRITRIDISSEENYNLKDLQLDEFKNLTELNLRYVDAESLKIVDGLKNLKSLKLYSPQDIDLAFLNKSQITKLGIRCKNLKNIENLFKLENLTELTIYTESEFDISKLSELKKLIELNVNFEPEESIKEKFVNDIVINTKPKINWQLQIFKIVIGINQQTKEGFSISFEKINNTKPLNHRKINKIKE